MARTVRDAKIESREARRKLPANSDKLWRGISQGAHIGYYKGRQAGTWYARCRLKGRYVKRTLGRADDNQDADGITVLNFAQAQDKAREWFKLAEQQALGLTPVKDITVNDAAQRYLDWFKDHRRGYQETLLAINAHILPSLGDKRVVDISAKVIRDWLNKLAATPARKRSKLGKKTAYHDAPQTDDAKRARKASANRTFAILKAMLNKAFQDELVKDDAAWRRVKPFSKVDEPKVRFLTEIESRRLLNACPEDLRELVRGALLTGARYSEIAKLQARDFNSDTSLVLIRQSKSGKSRHIPLSHEGFEYFKNITAGRAGEYILFKRDNGENWGRNHHVRALQAACKNAHIDPAIGFHELRHTYASLLAQAGADLLTISKLLGHSDTRVTSRHYAHLCDKALALIVQEKLPYFGYSADDKVVCLR